MTEEPTPVREGHVAFARALVALARQHGVGHIDATFSRASSAMFRRDEWNPTRVTLAWREGRHGNRDSISLRAEASVTVSEKSEEPQP